MAKLTLTTTSAGYALAATLNANNALIEAALENTLSRDGTTPNTMSADLDVNSNQITNLPVPTNDSHAASKSYVDGIVTGFTDAAEFSAALPYDVTGSWDFETLVDFTAGIRIMDATETDWFLAIHDGTDLNFTQSGTTDVNFPALTGDYIFADDVISQGFFRVDQDATPTSWGKLTVSGDILSITNGGNVTHISIAPAGSATHVEMTKPLLMLEKAAAVADVAGQGQIWVKDDAPNKLMYTDDAGTDREVVAQYARKTTDTAKTTDTTLADDPHLSLLLDASGWYEVELFLSYTQDVGDFKFSFSSTNTLNSSNMSWNAVDQVGATDEAAIVHTTSTTISTLNDSNARIHVIIKGMIMVGTSDSTVALQWAQGTSSANATTLQDSSYIKATKIADVS